MMEKVQRFGGAMFTPALLFTFSGIVVALSSICLNQAIVGSLATEGTTWFGLWSVISNGGWTVFNQMELLFVVGLPIGLAKHTNARAVMESLVIYLTFNYFVSTMIQYFGSTFGVDFTADAGGDSGLKLIAGIKTLDTGILGAIVISAIVVWLHNRYFNTKLPDFLGVFQGSSYVVILGYLIMIPVALLVCLVWPKIQGGISSMQSFFIASGAFGVWLYTFLERILIPTGLHHFVYTPFVYSDAVVTGGITKYWLANITEFAQSNASLKQLFPEGGFSLHGNSKVFASPGIAAAFYATARPENKKKVLALVVPATLTAILAGITEPLEFTFLFVAPPLFAVHAILAATMSTTMYVFGVVGNFGGGLIDFMAQNWIPLGAKHWQTYLIQIVIGLLFTAIYFFVFRFLIVKFNFLTPGRGEEESVKLYSKKEYKDKKGTSGGERYREAAACYLEALGGPDNIEKVTNCATRLRVTVIDDSLLDTDAVFKAAGAHGVVRNGQAIQVIVGLDVPQVRAQFEDLWEEAKKLA